MLQCGLQKGSFRPLLLNPKAWPCCCWTRGDRREKIIPSTEFDVLSMRPTTAAPCLHGMTACVAAMSFSLFINLCYNVFLMCLCCKYLILVVSSWNFVYSSICLERANCCDLGRAGVGARVKLWALSGGPAGVCSSQRSCQHCFRVSIRSVGHCSTAWKWGPFGRSCTLTKPQQRKMIVKFLSRP